MIIILKINKGNIKLYEHSQLLPVFYVNVIYKFTIKYNQQLVAVIIVLIDVNKFITSKLILVKH